MDFLVLGPLEVRDGGRPVTVGAGKQRALLALLLLHPNEVVSTDRLVDELWGERPPATVGKALQVYVSKLRKALGAERIVTRAPGYQLRVEPDELDLERFERLRARAHGAPAASAAELLRGALDLWRGPPLADLAFEPFLRPALLRLEEARLATIEDRIDAELELGRHGELAGELEALVATHPLRERLRGQHMLALYRSGRQAEALDAFRTARAALVDELGIEPGAALRELHERVLAQDPALLTEPAAADAPRDAAAPAAADERRLATVLHAELSSASDEDPERYEALLRDLHALAAEEVELAGGRVEWRQGDTLLATFGAARALEDHAARALAAALAVRERLRDAGVRIGVESGDVLVTAGSVVGGAVAEARRLATTAAPGEVAAGRRALAIGGAGFDVRGRSVTGGAPQGRGSRAGRTFVGREPELELLLATFDRVARDSRPHLVTVVGDAGIGKTSLVGALRERLADRAGWFVGRCAAHGRGATYRPVAEVVAQRLRLAPGAPHDVVLDRLGAHEALAPALGLPAPAGLHPWEARERLRDAWVAFLDELVAERPAVVVVEDLHWADEALLALVERAARDVAGPLLLLATARPELEPGPGPARGNATRVWLEPLSPAEAERMVEQLSAEELAPDARAEVVERAEGNPFFVEELLQSLRHEGRVAPGDSIQALIAARIDRLPDEERAALQAAAVAGRSFWRDSVAHLCDRPRLSLDLLEERDFVRRLARSSLPGQREFAFKHALTREVAYRSLPAGRRARLHAAQAEWLERVGGGRDEHAAALAQHYGEALAPQSHEAAWGGDERSAAAVRSGAVRWLRRAAELAHGRFEVRTASAFFRQAAALAPDPALRSELLRGAAHADLDRFDTDGFRDAMERAIALAPAGAPAGRLYAELAFEGSRPWVWQHPPARGDVTGWIDRALRDVEPGGTGRVHALLAQIYVDPAAGAEAAAEALRLTARSEDPVLLTDVYEGQAVVATAAGDPVGAATWVDRALPLLPAIGDPDKAAGRAFWAVFAYMRAGRLDDARRVAVRHDELCRRLTVHHHVHGITGLLVADTLAGRWQQASAAAARALAAAQANVEAPCQFNWRALLIAALACEQAGDRDAARRLEEDAGTRARGPVAQEPSLLRLALGRGDLDTAAALVEADPGADPWDVDYGAARLDALVALRDGESAEEEAEAAVGRGGYVEPFALRALGTVRGDRTLLSAAAERFAAMGLGWQAEQTRAAPRRTPPAGPRRAAL